MKHKMRARNYYAAAVSLFQDPSAEDCEIVMDILFRQRLNAHLSAGTIDFMTWISSSMTTSNTVWD